MIGAEVRRVSDTIICIRRASYLTCSYMIRTATGLILIDAGMSSDGSDVAGHTEGRVSYFYRPEKALFAGDALAVIDGRIRFMARPVTLDLDSARQSVKKCLALRPHLVCPGHREPLMAGVPAALDAMQAHLDVNGSWPLLG